MHQAFFNQFIPLILTVGLAKLVIAKKNWLKRKHIYWIFAVISENLSYIQEILMSILKISLLHITVTAVLPTKKLTFKLVICWNLSFSWKAIICLISFLNFTLYLNSVVFTFKILNYVTHCLLSEASLKCSFTHIAYWNRLSEKFSHVHQWWLWMRKYEHNLICLFLVYMLSNYYKKGKTKVVFEFCLFGNIW